MDKGMQEDSSINDSIGTQKTLLLNAEDGEKNIQEQRRPAERAPE
jgi:hypothetical protein